MGLFDSLAKTALSSLLGGNASQQPSSDVLSSLLSQVGGLSGLQGKFEQAGLGDVVGSWISTGENKAVSADQLQSALGSEAVSEAASKLGLDLKTVLPLISQFLPSIVDQLTPKGVIEDNQPSADQIQNVLANVMKGGLGSLLGGRTA